MRYFAIILAVCAVALPAHAGRFPLKLRCDFDKALEAGHYDWVHKLFSKEHAPKAACQEKKKVDVHLMHFGIPSGDYMTTEGVLEKMKEVECRPANWPELLALGATKPEIQRHDIVVALGSLIKTEGGEMGAPSLHGDRDGRGIALFSSTRGWVADDYGDPWVFAAVCGKSR